MRFVNIGTVTVKIEENLVSTFIANGNANILRGSDTSAGRVTGSNWAQCVACSVMKRQLRMGFRVSLQTCFLSCVIVKPPVHTMCVSFSL